MRNSRVLGAHHVQEGKPKGGGPHGQKGEGTSRQCLGRAPTQNSWRARLDSVADVPESSTGMEGHNVHSLVPHLDCRLVISSGRS